MKTQLLMRPVLQADGTSMPMLGPGSGCTHRAYLWSYNSSKYDELQIDLYNSADGRDGIHAQRFLGGCSGRPARPGRPIALFAPRRVGKTFFLDQDLTPAALAAGCTPVYGDIWLHRTSPLSAINHALEEALDDATVPAAAIGKTAETPVTKVGAFGAALEFGEESKRRALPAEPALRLETLVASPERIAILSEFPRIRVFSSSDDTSPRAQPPSARKRKGAA